MKNVISPMSNWLVAWTAQLLRNRAASIVAAALGVVQTPSSLAIHDDIDLERADGAFSGLVTSASYGFTNNFSFGDAYVEWSEDENFYSALTYEQIFPRSRFGGGPEGDPFLTFGTLYFLNEIDIAAKVDLNLDLTFRILQYPPAILVGTERVPFSFKMAFDPLDGTSSSVTIENPTRRTELDGVIYEMNFRFLNPQQASIPPDQWNTLIVPDGRDSRGAAEITFQFKRIGAVPDAGSSFAMLGSGLACMALLRRLRPAK